jgi:hypothetical protein
VPAAIAAYIGPDGSSIAKDLPVVAEVSLVGRAFYVA